MECNKGNSTWREKNLSISPERLDKKPKGQHMLGNEAQLQGGGDMGGRGGWLQSIVCLTALYQRSCFSLSLLIWQVTKSGASFKTMSLMIEGPIFTKKSDPNLTPQTHQTDIFLTQKNNTAVHIKIFYKCDFRWRIAEWKQYIDRSDVTACVSGSLVLSGSDSVVLGNSGLSSARARSGCTFLILFWILLSLTKGIFIFGSKLLVIKKNLETCVLRWWFHLRLGMCTSAQQPTPC